MKYQLQQAEVKLDVSELPSCTGDRIQINQLFSNLLDNSIKFLDPKRQGIINISGGTQDKQSVYRIEDNGIGIAPEHHGKIFEIFHKLSLSVEGEGIGLSEVQRIIDRHNGKILIESEKGKGSKFTVYLPRHNT
jgi:signal transduction histidine kinase